MNTVSFSAPITITRVAAPPRIDKSARASAWVKPEQAVFRSMTAGVDIFNAAETMPATFGERCSVVVVATSTRSTSPGSHSPLASAWRAAATAMSGTLSSAPAT